MESPEVIILTDERYETPDESHWYAAQLLHEERLLADALESRGLRTQRVAWSRQGFSWSRTRAAVFRSTWDYFDRFAAFSAWLDEVSQMTRLFNAPELLRWNLDKHYLRDLAARGVRLPPTHFIEPGDAGSLAAHCAACGLRQAILKPAVSGAARHTYRLEESTIRHHEIIFRELNRSEAMLLQPFLESVLTEGELSFIVIGGRCTHAVRKIAQPGDFRVQDDHGGTVHPHPLSPEEIAFAEHAVAACPAPPLYARVDAVRDHEGALSLMELEVVEPELFFRFHPPAADALAAALAAALEKPGADVPWLTGPQAGCVRP